MRYGEEELESCIEQRRPETLRANIKTREPRASRRQMQRLYLSHRFCAKVLQLIVFPTDHSDQPLQIPGRQRGLDTVPATGPRRSFVVFGCL